MIGAVCVSLPFQKKNVEKGRHSIYKYYYYYMYIIHTKFDPIFATCKKISQ